jgi:hypothetical protein
VPSSFWITSPGMPAIFRMLAAEWRNTPRFRENRDLTESSATNDNVADSAIHSDWPSAGAAPRRILHRGDGLRGSARGPGRAGYARNRGCYRNADVAWRCKTRRGALALEKDALSVRCNDCAKGLKQGAPVRDQAAMKPQPAFCTGDELLDRNLCLRTLRQTVQAAKGRPLHWPMRDETAVTRAFMRRAGAHARCDDSRPYFAEKTKRGPKTMTAAAGASA